jgi:hypothetical protein
MDKADKSASGSADGGLRKFRPKLYLPGDESTAFESSSCSQTVQKRRRSRIGRLGAADVDEEAYEGIGVFRWWLPVSASPDSGSDAQRLGTPGPVSSWEVELLVRLGARFVRAGGVAGGEVFEEGLVQEHGLSGTYSQQAASAQAFLQE